jgi:hypothetical protein
MEGVNPLVKRRLYEIRNMTTGNARINNNSMKGMEEFKDNNLDKLRKSMISKLSGSKKKMKRAKTEFMIIQSTNMSYVDKTQEIMIEKTEKTDV